MLIARPLQVVDQFLAGLPRMLMPVDTANIRLRLGTALQPAEYKAGEAILPPNADSGKVFVICTGTVHVHGMAAKDMRQAEQAEQNAFALIEELSAEAEQAAEAAKGADNEELQVAAVTAAERAAAAAAAESSGGRARPVAHSLGPGDVFGVCHRPGPVRAFTHPLLNTHTRTHTHLRAHPKEVPGPLEKSGGLQGFAATARTAVEVVWIGQRKLANVMQMAYEEAVRGARAAGIANGNVKAGNAGPVKLGNVGKVLSTTHMHYSRRPPTTLSSELG